MWKEEVAADLRALFEHFSGEIEEYHEKTTVWIVGIPA
jgi:hypothetical protein